MNRSPTTLVAALLHERVHEGRFHLLSWVGRFMCVGIPFSMGALTGSSLGEMLLQNLEGTSAGEHLEQDDAQRPDVGPLVDRFPPGLLRGHAHDHRPCASGRDIPGR